MAEDLIKYQCPKCGGTLEFSPSKQKLVCEYCSSEFDEDIINPKEESQENEIPQQEEKIDWRTESYVNNHEKIEDTAGFTCSSCGAEVVSDGNTAATECMYCGNPVVVQSNVSGMLKPDMLIPFTIEKKQAEELLSNFYKGKKLLPDEFTKNNRVSKVTGMYIPFWMFSCTGIGAATFNCKNVKTWSSGDYIYTKTTVHRAFRTGSLVFDKIPVDASKKMEDDYMDGLEPYDYRRLTQFDPKYMAGYFSDKFDVSVDESSYRANNRVRSSVKDRLQSTVNGYSSVTCETNNMNIAGEQIDYTLLPVWMLNTKYKGKMYQFAVNGQTGKVVGTLPIDKAKFWKWFLGFTALLTPICTAFAYFIIQTILAGG